MRRIDDDVVVELQVIAVERVKKFFGQLLRLIVSHQVGTSCRVDEQRIAAENSPRLRRAFLFGRFVRHMFGRVTGSMPRRQHQVAEFKLGAIFDGDVFELVLRLPFFADVDLRRPNAIGQFPRAAHQVGMDMRLEHVRDGDFALAGQLDVDFHVGPRIDHGRRARRIVADQVGERRNAFRLNAFENHGHAKIPSLRFRA